MRKVFLVINLFVCQLFVFCETFLQGEFPSTTNNVAIENNFETIDDGLIHKINEPQKSYAFTRNAFVHLPNYGVLEGSIRKTASTEKVIYQFLGVKYAESPSGANRFKAPIPIRSWRGLRSAQKYGQKCPKFDDLTQMTESERKKGDIEDCLNVSFHSYNLTASYPVMVYIHGGGFYSHHAIEFPPDYILEEKVVLAVVQYRLDGLGFLSTNTKEIPGNAGLLDAIQALKFTKENVEYFGGNPNNITVFGQSSGAAIVSAIAISSAVPEDLFQRIIVQSGSIFTPWAYLTNVDAEAEAREIAKFASLSSHEPMSSLNLAFIAMDVFDLLKAINNYVVKGLKNGKTVIGGRSITIGGPSNLFSDTPQNLVLNRQYNKTISMIIGVTKDDGSYFATVLYDILAMQNKLNDEDFMKKDLVTAVMVLSVPDNDGGTLGDLATSTYFNKTELATGKFSKNAAGIISTTGFLSFKEPALQLARANEYINPGKTFLYTFDYRGKYTRFGYGSDTSHYPFDGGVHHSDDLIYLFPYPKEVADLNEADTVMSRKFVKLWTSFAATGKAQLTDEEEFKWLPMSDNFGPFLHIDNEPRMSKNFLQ